MSVHGAVDLAAVVHDYKSLGPIELLDALAEERNETIEVIEVPRFPGMPSAMWLREARDDGSHHNVIAVAEGLDGLWAQALFHEGGHIKRGDDTRRQPASADQRETLGIVTKHLGSEGQLELIGCRKHSAETAESAEMELMCELFALELGLAMPCPPARDYNRVVRSLTPR